MSRLVTEQERDRWIRGASVLLLLLLFALLVTGARRLSMTQDEPAHVVGGYTLLARGKEGFWTFPQRGHPPLINLAQALLFFVSDPHVPVESLDGWGDNYVRYVADWRSHLVPIERTEVLSRMPVILLTVLLGALIFCWGRQLGGAPAGGLALVALTFDPLLLAHGRLATNDVGVTTLGTAALYTSWRWVQRPSWRVACVTGGLLGLTALAKASGALWTLAFAGLALVAVMGEPSRPQKKRLIAQAATACGCALVLLWGAYGFSVGRIEALSFPVPAPEHWVQLLRHRNVPTWRVFWALGKLWRGRQWWYYPLNFLIRNPLPLLGGLLVGGLALLKRLPGQYRRTSILIFPALYALVAVVQGTSVGYRHMLPLHPFLYLLWGCGLWAWAGSGSPWRWGVIAASGLWYGVETVSLFPDEITYFNQLVGGPGEGYRYLVDYTQDWGQSFKELRSWLAVHPGPEPGVAYYTYIHPGFYGVDFYPLPPADGADPLPAPWRPPPGRYAIGVTPLQGIVGQDRMTFEWFRHADPTAKIGRSLLVYDVDPFVGRWIAQCYTPTLPLTDTAIQEGLGRGDLRQVAFDCAQSWVYPAGEQGGGWYAFHGHLYAPNGLRQRLLYDPPRPLAPFLARHLRDLRFAYQQEQAAHLPPFVLYEASAQPAWPTLAQVWGAAAGMPPDALAADAPLSTPVSLEGPLDFLGARVSQHEEALALESWWRVTEGPVTRTVSLMAHLVTAEGQLVAVADGLGFSPLEWMPGDMLVQQHVFPLPPAGAEVWLRTGAYWLDDGARWGVEGEPEWDALFIPLAP